MPCAAYPHSASGSAGSVLQFAHSSYQNEMTTKTMQEEAAKEVDGKAGAAIVHSGLTIPASLAGAVTAPLDYLGQALGRTGQYKTLDPNAAGNLPNVYSSAVRQKVASDIAGDGSSFGRKAASYLYQGGMSALDTGARLLASGGNPTVAAGLAAMGSFGQTVAEASAQGASPAQAIAYGTVAAGIEAMTEKLPLDELVKTAKGGWKGLKPAIVNVLKQAGVEAMEEEISLIGTTLMEMLILQEKASYNQRIQQLVDEGMSLEDATEQANYELLGEAMDTAIVSAISGGLSSAGSSAVAYANRGSQDVQGAQNAEAAKVENAQPSNEKILNEAISDVIGAKDIDTGDAKNYNQNSENGGNNYAGNQGLSGIDEAGLPGGTGAGRIRGMGTEQIPGNGQASRGMETGGDLGPGSMEAGSRGGGYEVQLRVSPVLRVSDNLSTAQKNRGTPTYQVRDTTGQPKIYSAALVDGRNSDPVNGWCVTPKSAQELAEGNVRTLMNDTGTVGVGVAEDGDIVAVFKNKNGGPKRALDTAMPIAIEQGGDRLDCYGKGLVRAYENYGFVPVARVEFNPKYANDGWTPDKGTPYIYFMMHNGDSSAEVVEKMHRYPHKTKAELEALPTYGKDDYDAAMEYRNNLIDQRSADMDHGAVGAADNKDQREIRRSSLYDNTYKKTPDEEIRQIGETAEKLNPKIAEYEVIHEDESLRNANARTDTEEKRQAEYRYLTEKEGGMWTGEDNDTAFTILKQMQKEGNLDQFEVLAEAQKKSATKLGQAVQSFAKYSRNATKAAVDAVFSMNLLTQKDVADKFRNNDQEAFEQWKRDIKKTILDVANTIENIPDGDADAMKDVVRQLANFRKTTAWFGRSSKLAANAERALRKIDFNTAKDMTCAQLAMIPNDYQKRSVGEVLKAIRYSNMLSSLTTINTNLVGNSSMGLTDAMSDSTVGRFADMVMAQFTGKRTVTGDLKYAKEYWKAAIDSADVAALCAELDIPTEHDGKYTGKTRTFSAQGNGISRFLSAYEKYMNYALQVTDEFFSGGTQGAVSKSLEALGEKSGLSKDEIEALGDKVGQRRTFKEGRQLAKMGKGLKSAMNEVGIEGFGLGDLMIPFAETPSEMGQAAIDYSGAGLLLGIKEMTDVIKKAKAGETIDVLEQRKAASDFGRGMTGAVMIALSTALAAAGCIRAYEDEDKDKRALEQSMGLSGLEFNLDATMRAIKNEDATWKEGDTTVELNFLQPFNSQMYIGWLMSQEDDVASMIKAYPKSSVVGIAQSMLDLPMMGTVSDLSDLARSFTEVSEGDMSAVVDAGGKMLGNIGGSFVPAWLRQTAQYIDPVYRDTSGENATEKAVNQIKSYIPGLSKTLPAKYNGLGEADTRYDDPVLGFFDTFLLPGNVRKISPNEITQELEALGDPSVYPDSVAPKSFKVNGEEVMVSGKEMTETYQKTYGENVSAMYGGLMESKDFQNLSREQKLAALNKAETYATQFAKASVSDYKNVQEGTPDELVWKIISDVVVNTVSDAMDKTVESFEYGNTSEAVAALEDAYKVYKSMSIKERKMIMETASGRTEDFLLASAAGIKADTFVKLYEQYNSINKSDMKSAQKAQKWAHALQQAREDNLINDAQLYSLKTNMGISSGFTVVASTYDNLVDIGLDAKDADSLSGALSALKPETGKSDVRTVQKMEAAASATYLTEKERIAVMKLYLTDSQSEKMDKIMQQLKLSAEAYAAIYRTHLEDDKKAEEIQKYVNMGYSEEKAELIYSIYNGKS